MSLAFFVALALLAGLVVLTSFVQLLYLESLRLRSRESAALNHFKEEYEDRLGLKLETGALTFSLVKHPHRTPRRLRHGLHGHGP